MTITNQDVLDAITPNDEQKKLLYVIAGYIVGILILWNVPYLKMIIYPFKLVTVSFHEFGHAFAGVITGAKIHSITIEPDEGGLTQMTGGNPCCTIPAGYLGSSLIGALMIFCGFNTIASKVCTVVVGVALLATMWWARNWLARVIAVLFIGLLAFLWWLQGGVGLRYFVAFMGTMSVLYSLYETVDHLIVNKRNESDAVVYAKYTGCPSRVCGFTWFIVSLVFMAAAIIAGIAAFKHTNDTASAPATGN
ncbi:hypothetical protein GQ42DRAFT_154254 [Ramicandelaber brevisporus]|nr:hypothetical protein GQ42DRAFT_154254 [Ramicandelaber brevisporus]